MRKLLVIIFLMIGGAVISLSAQGLSEKENGMMEPAPAPHLQLDSTVIDMGRIQLDSIGKATMRLRNTGDADLQIIRIYSECGCTVPSYSTDPIPPGGEGEIKIRFKSRNRPRGLFFKTLRIRSNADNPRVNLTVKGIID